MRTQLIICALVVAVLFTCGIVTLNCALRLCQHIENKRTRTIALYDGITAENPPATSANMEARGER